MPRQADNYIEFHRKLINLVYFYFKKCHWNTDNDDAGNTNDEN